VFHVMPCFSGVTPVSIEVCDGSVTAKSVVLAHMVNEPRARRACIVGASARSMRSGRSPSTLTTRTRETGVLGRAAVGAP
jgi:hypothetical protein